MPNRDQTMQKILLSLVCTDKKTPVTSNQPGSCYELQSRLSPEQPNERHVMGMQTMPHPPIERLNTNVGCQKGNRFAKEMFTKYPFMLPPRLDKKQEMAGEQVGTTTYRTQYRKPDEVIEELERCQLVRTSLLAWKRENEPISLAGRQYRSGSKINFTQNEWGSRQIAAEKHAEDSIYMHKKEKFYPWISEYRANIESMAKLINENDIFRREKILVKRVHTLPN